MIARTKRPAVRRVRRTLLTAAASAEEVGEGGRLKATDQSETDGDC